MELIQELIHFHQWATMRLIDHCTTLPPKTLLEIVPATDRTILHTLTHVVASEQRYLDSLTGETPVSPIQRGEILSIADIRRRAALQSPRWDSLLGRLDQIEVILPADEEGPAIPHAQNLLILQALQHGIDHCTQICTALSLLGMPAPLMDGWTYWANIYPYR